jgi:maleylacetoacetate isomerase
MSVVLYDYWRSSASYRVRIALHLAGIAFDILPVDLAAGDQRSAAHLQRNPQGFVPVLDIDGHRLTQSLAIIAYLDETRGLGLLPADAADRARVRALAMAIAVDLHPVCNLSVVNHALSLGGEAEGARAAWMAHFIAPGLAAFEALLAGFDQSPFCCGDRPGLADLCLIPQLYNATRWGVSLPHCPRIAGVAAACAGHPAFVAAHPDKVRPAKS